MNIELKNLHTEKDLSFFDADLWINGKEAGYVTYKQGASMAIKETGTKGRDLIDEAKDYCEKLPPLQVKDKSKTIMVEMNLEMFLLKMVIGEHVQKQQHTKPEEKIKQPTKKKGRSR